MPERVPKSSEPMIRLRKGPIRGMMMLATITERRKEKMGSMLPAIYPWL
jgi:hypothetical protein